MRRGHLLSLVFQISSFLLPVALAQDDDFSCNINKPCSNGACCGPSGFCGYGDAFCGTGCTSNCDAHAACGKDALVPGTKCPLNVCCSQFGFCGTTSDFCDTGCQNGCSAPSPKKCSGNSATQRIIGYYESWATSRPCSAWYPEQLNPNGYTHINFAFASIDGSTYSIIPASPSDIDLYTRTTSLKQLNPDLKVFISVGGWAFNDPPTQNIFSNLAADSGHRQAFIKSLISFFQTYGFDGVDIDWEYPVAPERGGVAADKENFVTLLKEIRAAFDSSPGKYGLTITIPSSFWYLQNFDIVAMEPYLDWFNAMEYDLHGTWDGTDPFIGPVVNAHSNLTEINISFDLLWRNGIDPNKVVMGTGFYGRSFQLANPSCSKPGCAFSGPADAGPCTGSPGTLSYSEIQDIIKQKSVTPVWDHTAAVKYITWDNNQWVSYDDADTFKQKIDYANSLCLGGIMIWSADQDDSSGTALSAITGNAPQIAQALSTKSLAASYSTGQICTVTDCGQTCSAGFTALAVTKGQPTQPTYKCKKGQSREICCPSAAVPTGCLWRGTAPFCDGKCHDGEVQLTQDNSGDGHSCWTGTKALCCPESTNEEVLGQCTWHGTAPFCDGKCPTSGSGQTLQVTTGDGGQGNGAYCFTGHKALCCPNPAPYQNCGWFGTAPFCNGKCPLEQVQLQSDSSGDGHLCLTGKKVYCCDPPNTVVQPAVVQFENDLATFAQSPVCDASNRIFDRRRSVVTTPESADSKDSAIEARGTTDSQTINRLVLALSPLLALRYQNLDNDNALPLNAAQLGMIDAFGHVAPSTFGGAEFDILALRYGLNQDVTFADDGPLDPQADVQDMVCEADDVSNISSEMLVATATFCLRQTGSTCKAPSTCGSGLQSRDYEDYEDEGYGSETFNTTDDSDYLSKRYFDENASRASGANGHNGIRPNLFDAINAIVNGRLPLLEFSLFNSNPGGPPDIQIEVVFDIRGHPELAEYDAVTAPPAGSNIPNNREPDQLMVVHFHLAEPECIIENTLADTARVNVRSVNIWHGQHAGLHINSPNVPFIEVGGRDRQRRNGNAARPGTWGANQRAIMLSCTGGTYWPVEACPNPPVQLGRNRNGDQIPQTRANIARANLIGRLIQYLIQQNILVWDFVEWMWDFDNGAWYDDPDHQRGPRFGPGGGGAAGGLNRGVTQLTNI